MRRIFEKLRDPATYLGLGVAVTGINWSSVAPAFSQSWWLSVVAVVAGLVGFVSRPPQ